MRQSRMVAADQWDTLRVVRRCFKRLVEKLGCRCFFAGYLRKHQL